MKKIFFLLSFFVIAFQMQIKAQATDSTSQFKISGYVDGYYACYTDSVGLDAFQQFPAAAPRNEQFGLNIAMISAAYDGEKLRGVVAFQYGDFSKVVWSGTFPHIYEAHGGIRIFKNLWLDAGFFKTHLGTEGLLPKENMLSSWSMITFFEPAYEAGARLDFEPNDQVSVSLYGLNGYNLYEENNSKKSIGIAMLFGLGENNSFGYSNYIGDDFQDGNADSHLRIHQNMFINLNAGNLFFQMGGDYVMQQHSQISRPLNQATMYGGMATLRYTFFKTISLTTRAEVLNDPDGILTGIISDTDNKQTGLKAWGVTAGLGYQPTEQSYFRLEGRKLQMDKKQRIFYQDGINKTGRLEFSASVGVSF